jgi:serine/threonine protein phosphatase PrpC
MNFKNYRFGNHTDIGKVRKQNEDYLGFFETKNGEVFVVCDGMGGHAGGAIASQTAVQSIRQYLENQYFGNPQEAIFQALQVANQEIYYKAQINAELRGMGTTCVLLLLRNGQAYWGHIGDSRLYLCRQGQIQRLTKDHSFVQSLVDLGLIDDQEAEQHPRKNELLKAMGTDLISDPEVYGSSLTPLQGDCFLLCTDGLNSLVSDEGILEVLQAKIDIQYKALRLVEIANAMGGYDNITVQLLEFIGDEITQGNQSQHNYLNTTPLSQTKPDIEEIKKKPNLELEDADFKASTTLKSRTFSKKKSKSNPDDEDMVIMDNSDSVMDYRPVLFKVFSFVLGAIILYVLYENTLGELNVLGSRGSVKEDSLAAIDIQNRFYTYFWNSSPELQKVKKGIDETKQTIREIQELKRKAKESLDRFFENKRIRQIQNSLSQESLDRLARRYNSRLEWILKANGVKSEQELKKLDSLFVPLEAPKDSLKQP